jgi:protein-L-isoaspartate O-methyltransferase
MLGVTLRDAQLDYATLLFQVEIDNRSAHEVSPTALRYSLTSGPNSFLSAAPVANVTVPAHARNTVSLPHRLVYERLLRALNARPGVRVACDVRAKLTVTSAGAPAADLTLECEDTLTFPQPPEVREGDGKAKIVDVIYISTPHDVVARMLQMARVDDEDVLYDLGCGDGRIVVAAARDYGCRAVGYDVDPRRVRESRENARRNGVENLVAIEQQDIFTVDLRPADVVALYLTPRLNRRLIPQLRRLRPGARIVSHSFPIGDIEPDEVVTMTSVEDNKQHRIYLYRTPLTPDADASGSDAARSLR